MLTRIEAAGHTRYAQRQHQARQGQRSAWDLSADPRNVSLPPRQTSTSEAYPCPHGAFRAKHSFVQPRTSSRLGGPLGSRSPIQSDFVDEGLLALPALEADPVQQEAAFERHARGAKAQNPTVAFALHLLATGRQLQLAKKAGQRRTAAVQALLRVACVHTEQVPHHGHFQAVEQSVAIAVEDLGQLRREARVVENGGEVAAAGGGEEPVALFGVEVAGRLEHVPARRHHLILEEVEHVLCGQEARVLAARDESGAERRSGHPPRERPGAGSGHTPQNLHLCAGVPSPLDFQLRPRIRLVCWQMKWHRRSGSGSCGPLNLAKHKAQSAARIGRRTESRRDTED
eukprot:scaffold868_cov249-Pinguiococcus_pyrenoidosus.AAC.4